jgi:hypothetical protein
MLIPEDGVVDGYQANTNSTCSYCDGLCETPDVNSNIGFLDGFSWHIVGWSYLTFFIFTIIYQIVSCICRKKMPENNSNSVASSAGNGPSDNSIIRNGNVNATIETSRVYSDHDNTTTVLQKDKGKDTYDYKEVPSGKKAE